MFSLPYMYNIFYTCIFLFAGDVGNSSGSIHEQHLVGCYSYQMQLKSFQYLILYPIAATNTVLLAKVLQPFPRIDWFIIRGLPRPKRNGKLNK
jgi:hypothetical protein